MPIVSGNPSDDESTDDFVDAEDIDISNCDKNGELLSHDTCVDANLKDVEREMLQEFKLHHAIFDRKSVDEIAQILRDWKQRSSKSFSQMVNQKDLHGNTPLHLAVMLGQKDLIQLLLTHEAAIKSRNLQGWTPLDEAISYGDRKIIKMILKTGRKQARKLMDSRRPKLIKALSLISDFQMELKWEFYSWVPILKRFLPSDTCHLTKKGSSIRLDTTLVDFSDRNWQRGDITFLFVGSKKSSKALSVLDNELKVYQAVRYNESTDIDEDIDLLMSSDIIHPQMSTKSITFSRTQSGWFFSRYNKTEKVGQFEADFYNINGLQIESKKRREHLSELDVQSNKALLDNLKKSLENSKSDKDLIETNDEELENEESNGLCESSANSASRKDKQTGKGNHSLTDSSSSSSINESLHASSSNNATRDCDAVDYEDDDGDEQTLAAFDKQAQLLQIKRRKSLLPPSIALVSWFEYINAPVGSPPSLARPLKLKESTRTFKATVAMSKEFPLSVESLLDVLEVVAPFKHFNKLRQFIQLNLPPGFPVKIDIPIVPAVLARVTFLNFQFSDQIADSLFDIPADYTEDPNRFPEI